MNKWAHGLALATVFTFVGCNGNDNDTGSLIEEASCTVTPSVMGDPTAEAIGVPFAEAIGTPYSATRKNSANTPLDLGNIEAGTAITLKLSGDATSCAVTATAGNIGDGASIYVESKLPNATNTELDIYTEGSIGNGMKVLSNDSTTKVFVNNEPLNCYQNNNPASVDPSKGTTCPVQSSQHHTYSMGSEPAL